MNLSVVSVTGALMPAVIIAAVMWLVLRQRSAFTAAAVLILGGAMCHVFTILILRGLSVFGVVTLEGETTTLSGAALDAFIHAAFPEELARFLLLLLVCAILRCWSKPAEVVQHCALISIGFAAIENLFYSFISTENLAVLFRVVPTLSHAFDGVIMGYLVAGTMVASDWRWMRMTLAVSVPMILHFLFDFGQFGVEVLGPKIDALDLEAEPSFEAVGLIGGGLLLMGLPPLVWILEAVAATLIVHRIRRSTRIAITASPHVVSS